MPQHKGDETAARFLKQQTLPYVTPAAYSPDDGSDCLTESSGLVVVDIDHLESAEETENLRQQLFDDPIYALRWCSSAPPDGA